MPDNSRHDLNLKGREAAGDGRASSGIGRAIALELGREGVRLAITRPAAREPGSGARRNRCDGHAKANVIVHEALEEVTSTRSQANRRPRSARSTSS
jgi:NAD(P)-dependent dehydrogenase (short-subunit alcohol dehydrogenase family)